MATSNSNFPTANGGIWNTQKVSYSQETHNLLKEMMKESKLTMFQQNHIDKTMKHGKTLPLNVPPTHSYKEKIIKHPPRPSKVINARRYSGGIRTKDSMERMGAFEKPDYKPRPQRCRTEKEKERLGNLMAYGQDVPPANMEKAIQRVLPEDEPYVDRFDELQSEVQERREFLDEMIALGKGDNYQQIIETEISQKVREMEIIDRKRTEELNERLQNIANDSHNAQTISQTNKLDTS